MAENPSNVSGVSAAPSSDLQRRYREFLDLMPLIINIAGLPPSEHGRYYSEEQIETRLFALRHAYKAARQLVRELVTRGG